MDHQHDAGGGGEGEGGGGGGSMKVFDAVTKLIKKKYYREASECVKMAMETFYPEEERFLDRYGLGMLIVSETLHYGNLILPDSDDGFHYYSFVSNQYVFDYYSVLHLPPSSTHRQVKDRYYKLRNEVARLTNIGFHGAALAESLLSLAKSNLCDKIIRSNFDSKRKDFVFLDWPPPNETAIASSFKRIYLGWKPPVYHVDVIDHMKSAHFLDDDEKEEVVEKEKEKEKEKEEESDDDDDDESDEEEEEEEEEESSDDDDDEEDTSLSPELRILKKKVFDEMPQNPHYTPLEKYTGRVRGGMILGLEVAFTELCDEIKNLEDVQSFWNELDGFIEEISQLKEMGYDVEKVSKKIAILKSIAEHKRASRAAAKKCENEVGDREAKVIDLQTRISELQTEIEESKSKIQTFKKVSSDAGVKFAAVVKSKWV